MSVAAAVGGPSEAEQVPFDPAEGFEVFDERNRTTGQVMPRATVHSRGLYHRSVSVLVFNRADELLLQRRHARKDTAPSCWDLSCAEHLKPHESYEAAASRGLQEELGIADAACEAVFSEAFLQENEYPDLPVPAIDREFVMVFKLEGFNGDVRWDPNEVAEVKWASPEQLVGDLATNPSAYAPWVANSVARLQAAGVLPFS